MTEVIKYTGAIPVDTDVLRDWSERGVPRVRIEFMASIYDMILCGDVGAWNDWVGWTIGVSLTDLVYGYAKPDPDDDIPEDSVVALMFVEGDIDHDWLRFSLGTNVA